MYGSLVSPKIAGIESSAKIRSVKAIATKTIVNEEAPLFSYEEISALREP